MCVCTSVWGSVCVVVCMGFAVGVCLHILIAPQTSAALEHNKVFFLYSHVVFVQL